MLHPMRKTTPFCENMNEVRTLLKNIMLELKKVWKAIRAVITLRKASLIMKIKSSISVNVVQINNLFS